MNSNQMPRSRFCYSYTPPGPIDNCCYRAPCTTSQPYLSSLANISSVIYNNGQTTERSLLLGAQQQYFRDNSASITSTIVQSTIANNAAITSTIYGQLYQIRTDRYEPYQPYIYPVIPPSVMELQMNTANVGVPHSFFTCTDGKGVQSVTT
jgi:hypothetical protein